MRPIKLPRIINDYVNASNAHKVKSVVACFADNALVHDEGKDFRGKEMIETWIVRTIDKYKFHFRPVTFREDNAEVVVVIEVSGTFDGSPITLDYHFTIEGDKFLSLTIDWCPNMARPLMLRRDPVFLPRKRSEHTLKHG